jgi:hypothetical protein
VVPKARRTHEDNLVVEHHAPVTAVNERQPRARVEDRAAVEDRRNIAVPLANVLLPRGEVTVQEAQRAVVNQQACRDRTL